MPGKALQSMLATERSSGLMLLGSSKGFWRKARKSQVRFASLEKRWMHKRPARLGLLERGGQQLRGWCALAQSLADGERAPRVTGLK